MGQSICVLILPGINKIDDGVVRFYEDATTIVPISAEMYDDDPLSLNLFLAHTIKGIDLQYALDLSHEVILAEDENGIRYKDFSSLANLIIKVSKGTFILEYYSEWADIPDEHLYLTVIDRKVISCANNYKDENFKNTPGDNFDTLDAIKSLFGLKKSWMANESRYFTYQHSYEEYFNKDSR